MLHLGCCCGTCDIGSDTFTRSDDTNIGAGWSETVGDWEIATNELLTASDGGRAIFQTPDTAGNVPVGVSANVMAGDGDKARLILKYLDASNYWYAELKVGTGAWLRIYSVISGTPTLLATNNITAAADAWHNMSFCYGDGKAAARITGYATIETLATAIDDQLYAGVEAGVAGFAVFFDDFRYYRATGAGLCLKCVGAEACNECATLGPPAQLDVTLPNGWSADICAAADCESINGITVTVTAADDNFAMAQGPCEPDDGRPVAGGTVPLECYYNYWVDNIAISQVCSTFSEASLTVQLRIRHNTTTGKCSLRVLIGVADPAHARSTYALYELIDFEPFDFTAPFEVPYVSSDFCGGFGEGPCAFTASGDPITVQLH